MFIRFVCLGLFLQCICNTLKVPTAVLIHMDTYIVYLSDCLYSIVQKMLPILLLTRNGLYLQHLGTCV